MSYVVASAIKQFVNDKGFNAAGDLADAASKHLAAALGKACDRAKANGRKTIRPEDL